MRSESLTSKSSENGEASNELPSVFFSPICRMQSNDWLQVVVFFISKGLLQSSQFSFHVMEMKPISIKRMYEVGGLR